MRIKAMATKKVLTGSAVLLLAVGGLAACSGGDGEGASGSDENTSEEAGGLTQDNFGTTISEAVADAGSVRFEASSSGDAGFNAEGIQAIGETAETAQLAFTMTLNATQIEARLIDQVVYLKSDEITQGKFAAVDLSDPDDPAAAEMSSLTSELNFADDFEQFSQAATGFEKGDDSIDVDGVEAQQYTLTMDPVKLAEAQGESASGSSSPVIYEIFIGPDNLPRRITTGASSQQIVVDFSDWGADVAIDKPGDAEISELSLDELRQQAGQ